MLHGFKPRHSHLFCLFEDVRKEIVWLILQPMCNFLPWVLLLEESTLASETRLPAFVWMLLGWLWLSLLSFPVIAVACNQVFVLFFKLECLRTSMQHFSLLGFLFPLWQSKLTSTLLRMYLQSLYVHCPAWKGLYERTTYLREEELDSFLNPVRRWRLWVFVWKVQ